MNSSPTPRHMTLANARIINNTSSVVAAEITKLVKQHYDPPPAPPYKYSKICQRTSQTLLHERPDTKWEENYRRHAHNMQCGYYSVPNEPYKNVGGKFDLDPYDLVLNEMGESLDDKVWDNLRSKDGVGIKPRQTPPSKKRRQSLLPPLPSHAFDKMNPALESVTFFNEENKSDGGIGIVKNQLVGLDKVVRKVRANQTFEGSNQHFQDLKLSNMVTDENDMVLLSMSTEPFLPENKSEADIYLNNDKHSTICSMSYLREHMDGSGKLPESPDVEIFSLDRKSANSLCMAATHNSGLCQTDCQSSIFKGHRKSVYLRSATSLFPVSNMENNLIVRKERQKRIHMQFLEALHIVIHTLTSMKTRDIKSKTPLSLEYLKQLRKDIIHTHHTLGDGRESRFASRSSRPFKNASVVTVPSVMNDTGKKPGFGSMLGKKKNMFEQMALIPAKLQANTKKLEIRQKPKSDELNLETWEDFLAVDPTYVKPKKQRKKSFATGVQILVKAVMWQRRISNLFESPRLSPETSQSPEKETATKIEKIAKQMYNEPGKKPVSKKIPIWQKIAAEKPELYAEKKSNTEEKIAPEYIVSDMKRKFNNLKSKHEQETEVEVQKLERERLLIFKYKYGLFNHMSPIFESHMTLLENARDSINQNIDIGEVEPCKWYEDLKEKTLNVCGNREDTDDLLNKIGRHAFMDSKSVYLGKSKLCLLVMSLPAYEICTVAYQTAIKFVLEAIMLQDVSNLKDWLELRKVPYTVYDSKDNKKEDLFDKVEFS